MATRFQVLKFHRTSLVGTLGFAGLKRSDCFKFRPGNVNSPSCLETESCRPSERSGLVWPGYPSFKRLASNRMAWLFWIIASWQILAVETQSFSCFQDRSSGLSSFRFSTHGVRCWAGSEQAFNRTKWVKGINKSTRLHIWIHLKVSFSHMSYNLRTFLCTSSASKVWWSQNQAQRLWCQRWYAPHLDAVDVLSIRFSAKSPDLRELRSQNISKQVTPSRTHTLSVNLLSAP